MTNHIGRALSLLYPPSFRDTHGAEFTPALTELPVRPRLVLEVLFGAARAWLRPVMPTDGGRARLLATASTIWICLGIVTASVPAVSRAVLDPPVAGVSAGTQQLLDVALWLLGVALLLAGGCAAALAAHSLPDAWLRRRREILWPTAALLGSAVLVGALTAVVALLREPHPANWPHPSIAFIIAGLAWFASMLGFWTAAAIVPLLVARRLPLPLTWLRPCLRAGYLIVALTAVIVTLEVAVIASVAWQPLAVVAVMIAISAVVVSVVSAGRATRAA